MHILKLRQQATQATRDRFFGRPFAWGRDDCGKMTVFHLKALGLPFAAAKMGGYETAMGAKRALGRLGFKTLSEAADAQFPRIAPAAAMMGDLMLLPGNDAFGAFVIAVGNGRVLGWHEEAEGAVIMQPLRFETAWRLV
jgi:hypothetical protein